MFLRKIDFYQTPISEKNLDTQIQARIEKLESLQKQKPLLYGTTTKSEADSLRECLSQPESAKRAALRDFDEWLKMPKNKILWDDFNVTPPQKSTFATEAKNTTGFKEEVTISTLRKPPIKIEFTYKATLFGFGNLDAQVQARINKIGELAESSESIRLDNALKKKIENLKRYLPNSSLGYTTLDQKQHLIRFDQWLQKKQPDIWGKFRTSTTLSAASKNEMKPAGKWFSEHSCNNFFASNKDNIDKGIKLVSPKKESLLSRLIHKIRR